MTDDPVVQRANAAPAQETPVVLAAISAVHVVPSAENCIATVAMIEHNLGGNATAVVCAIVVGTPG